MPLAEVRVDWHEGIPVAAVDGEVDASNAGDVAADLRALVTNRSTDLVVDLTPTRYLDSAGINLLFSLGEALRARQLTLRLVIAVGSPVSRMLTITGMDRAHATHPTVADALSAQASF
jgi:anti-sigma B factor antagonist